MYLLRTVYIIYTLIFIYILWISLEIPRLFLALIIIQQCVVYFKKTKERRTKKTKKEQTRNLTPGSNRSTLRFRNQFTRWTSSFNDRTILEQSHRVFETSFLQKSLVHTCANIEHRAKNWMNVEQHCSVQSREIQTMDPVRSSVQLRLIPEPREEPRESTNTADGDGAVDFPPNRTRFESKGRLGYSPAGIWPNWLRDRCATMGGRETPRMHLRAVKQNPQIHPYLFGSLLADIRTFHSISSPPPLGEEEKVRWILRKFEAFRSIVPSKFEAFDWTRHIRFRLTPLSLSLVLVARTLQTYNFISVFF